jgi:hypothetical protein
MKVYHASKFIIESPDIYHSRDLLDFGKGFYLTSLVEQAKKYAQRFLFQGDKAYLNQYILDENLDREHEEGFGFSNDGYDGNGQHHSKCTIQTLWPLALSWRLLQTNCHYYRDSPCNNHSHQQPPEQERPSGDGIGIFAQQQDAHRL